MRGRLPTNRVMAMAVSDAEAAPASKNTQSVRGPKLATDAERHDTIHARQRPNPTITIT